MLTGSGINAIPFLMDCAKEKTEKKSNAIVRIFFMAGC
jgi:hypothetical protein